MRITAGALAQAIGARAEGDERVALVGIAELSEAGPHQVSFLSNPRYRSLAKATRAGALIVSEREGALGARCLLRAKDPYLAYARAVAEFHPASTRTGSISPWAVVEDGARLGEQVTVEALAFIGAGSAIGARSYVGVGSVVGRGVTVGEDCLFHARVTLYDDVRVGHRVTLHSGAVIGSDGFGYARDGARYVKIPQVGTVEIGDDVEIGAGSCVDRAALGRTIIGRGSKIDNLVQVAHNVVLGEDVAIAALSGISGSSRVGDGSQLAGQSGVSGHLAIGRNVIVSGKSAVFKDLPDGSFVSGIPARPHREWLRREAACNRIHELEERLERLEAARGKGRARAGAPHAKRRGRGERDP